MKYVISTVFPIISLFALLFSSISQAQEMESMEDIYDDYITIASGTKQSRSKAPAVTTVITAEDIKKLGANTLAQVLETTPGLHVSIRSNYGPIYTFRGIYAETNPQVQLQINGISITNVFAGDRGQLWGDYPINNISRIEIIRGPGSALYGADAYAGVINIITKQAAEIDGTEIGVRLGSYNTRDLWLLHGDKWGSYDVSFSLETHGTDGQKELITADLQTAIDSLAPTGVAAASLAPGSVNTQQDNLDLRFDIKKDKLQLRIGYQERNDIGTGAGIAQALDPQGTSNSARFNADLNYDNKTLHPDWELKIQMSYYDTSTTSKLTLFPAGAGFGKFPAGIIGNPDIYERHKNLNFTTLYHGMKNHNILLGGGQKNSNMYRVNESKNFLTTIVDNSPVNIPINDAVSVVDVSNSSSVFITPHQRTVTHLFIQDEWSLASDWILTTGIRYDDYSDFGSTTNPRLALVWQSAYNLTSKFLYGKAFRPPSFSELYNINNPVALGDSDLEPETIDTYELAFNYKPRLNMDININFFHYRMANILRIVADSNTAFGVATNTGKQNGTGMELEMTWQAHKNLALTANVATQKSTDQASNINAGYAPQTQAYLRADWMMFSQWYLDSRANYIGSRKRSADDTRENIKNYVDVNVSLRFKARTQPLELSFTVNNLLDSEQREPSRAGTPVAIPNDLPLPRRNIIVGLSYRL